MIYVICLKPITGEMYLEEFETIAELNEAITNKEIDNNYIDMIISGKELKLQWSPWHKDYIVA